MESLIKVAPYISTLYAALITIYTYRLRRDNQSLQHSLKLEENKQQEDYKAHATAREKTKEKLIEALMHLSEISSADIETARSMIKLAQSKVSGAEENLRLMVINEQFADWHANSRDTVGRFKMMFEMMELELELKGAEGNETIRLLTALTQRVNSI